jgi:hypothetical protein
MHTFIYSYKRDDMTLNGRCDVDLLTHVEGNHLSGTR